MLPAGWPTSCPRRSPVGTPSCTTAFRKGSRRTRRCRFSHRPVFPDLLRRHVAHRSKTTPGSVACNAGRKGSSARRSSPLPRAGARKAEVQDLHAASFVKNTFSGFRSGGRVTLSCAAASRARAGSRSRSALRGDRRSPASSARSVASRSSGPVRRTLVRPDVVDRRDVRVFEKSRRARLLLESAQAVRVFENDAGSTLNRERRAPGGDLRAIDLPIPPAPSGAKRFVGAETGSGGKAHPVITKWSGRAGSNGSARSR